MMRWLILNNYPSDPTENCHLNVKKKSQKLDIFSKNSNGNYLERNDNFCLIFEKMSSFCLFLTGKWQFSGGSVIHIAKYSIEIILKCNVI